jgi:hypothetical protein
MPRKILGTCATPGCPNRADCAKHKRTTTSRDYGADHQRERADWQRRINSGEVVCCRRCNQPIPPHDPMAWDLGHPAPKAPECRKHNRATMGRDRA